MQAILQPSLFRARLLLEEGRSKDALDVLQSVETLEKDRQAEAAYLQSWAYIQNRLWDDAARVLSPLLQDAIIDGSQQEPLSDYERRIAYFMNLGRVAVNLARYDDGCKHYLLCLKLLRERRVHLPLVRIHVHTYLATTYLMKSALRQAIEQYGEALRLCLRDEEFADELPAIYYGLCDSYNRLKDFPTAYDFGQSALALYQRQGQTQFEVRMDNLLGSVASHTNDVEAANDHYRRSLYMAKEYNQEAMIMLNYAGLAELHVQQGLFEQAKDDANQALAYAQQSENAYLSSGVFNGIANVLMKIADEQEEPYRHEMYEQSLLYFEEACRRLQDAQAPQELANLYKDWSQALEALGRDHEAFKYMREAFLIGARIGQ